MLWSAQIVVEPYIGKVRVVKGLSPIQLSYESVNQCQRTEIRIEMEKVELLAEFPL